MEKNYLIVKIKRNHIRKIFLKEILYIKADGSYCEIYLINKQIIVVTRILKTFEFLTEKYFFHRVNKSYIINSDYAIELLKGKQNCVVMIDKHIIPVNRKYYAIFVEKVFLL